MCLRMARFVDFNDIKNENVQGDKRVLKITHTYSSMSESEMKI